MSKLEIPENKITKSFEKPHFFFSSIVMLLLFFFSMNAARSKLVALTELKTG